MNELELCFVMFLFVMDIMVIWSGVNFGGKGVKLVLFLVTVWLPHQHLELFKSNNGKEDHKSLDSLRK